MTWESELPDRMEQLRTWMASPEFREEIEPMLDEMRVEIWRAEVDQLEAWFQLAQNPPVDEGDDDHDQT